MGSTELIFYVFLFLHAIFDAMRDGYIWDKMFGDGEVSFVDERNWHTVKTLGRLSLLATGIMFTFLMVSNGLVKALCELVVGSILALEIWKMVYNRVRYQEFFDLSDVHNESWIFLPNWLAKEKIAIPNRYVPYMHLGLWVVGVGLIYVVEVLWS